MFGIIGTALYGILFTHEWNKEEKNEKQSREWAKKNKNLTYRDKWGNERYTLTGKKRKISSYQTELHNDLRKMRKDFKDIKNINNNKVQDFINKKQFEYNKRNIYNNWNLSLEEYIIASTSMPKKWEDIYDYYMELISKCSRDRYYELLIIGFKKAKWRYERNL